MLQGGAYTAVIVEVMEFPQFCAVQIESVFWYGTAAGYVIFVLAYVAIAAGWFEFGGVFMGGRGGVFGRG